MELGSLFSESHMKQSPIVPNQASGSNVDKTEVQNHQDSVPGAGAGAVVADSNAAKNAQESGSGHVGFALNVDKNEVQKHQDSFSTAGPADSKEAVKNDQEFGSGHSGSVSSLPDPFTDFTRDGAVSRVNENTAGYRYSKKKFMSAMGLAAGDTTVVAIHKYPITNPTQQPRVESFRAYVTEMIDKNRGIFQNAHLLIGLYGGSRDEIAHILVHGFSAVNAKGGAHGCVQLVPAPHYLDAALSCVVDEAGLRHLLMCRVIVGSVQFVPDGWNHVFPEFDSGVDNLTHPRMLYVPAGTANARICAESVISFRAPSCLWEYATYATQSSGGFFGARFRPQQFPINLLKVLDELIPRFVTFEEMVAVLELFKAYRRNEISRGELIRKLKLAVGEEALAAAANRCK